MELPKLKNILIPVDEREAARGANRYAVALAKKFGAKVILFYAHPVISGRIDADGRRKIEQRNLESVQPILDLYTTELMKNDVSCEIVIGSGAAADAIVDAASNYACELIIMGGKKRSWSGKLFGSTASKVSDRSPIPVFVIGEGSNETSTNQAAFSPVPHLQKMYC